MFHGQMATSGLQCWKKEGQAIGFCPFTDLTSSDGKVSKLGVS